LLTNKTRRRVKYHNWTKISNKSQFFNRLKNQAHTAISDLALLAEKLDEAQLQEIFTTEKLEPLIRTLMRPDLTRTKEQYTQSDRDRIFFLGHLFLKWSLNITGSTLDNRWAREMYREHEGRLRSILEVLYYERRRKLHLPD